MRPIGELLAILCCRLGNFAGVTTSVLRISHSDGNQVADDQQDDRARGQSSRHEDDYPGSSAVRWSRYISILVLHDGMQSSSARAERTSVRLHSAHHAVLKGGLAGAANTTLSVPSRPILFDAVG